MTSHEATHGASVEAKLRNVNWTYVIGLGVAFLVGLTPGWYMAHTAGNDRDQARERLTYYRIVDESSAATLYATRGEYETARQKASGLFNDLRAVDTSDRLTASERQVLNTVLQQRDDVITLLANGF